MSKFITTIFDVILFASNNQDKIDEIKDILGTSRVYSLSEIGLDIDPEETGTTYQENSRIKLNETVKALEESGKLKDNVVLVIADDSGIKFDCMGGAPGVLSNRFMGNYTYEERNREIMELAKVFGRGALYGTALSYKIVGADDDLSGTVLGQTRMEVQEEMIVGRNFSYDSILKPYEYQGEDNFDTMSMQDRAKYSHRASALYDLLDNLTLVVYYKVAKGEEIL